MSRFIKTRKNRVNTPPGSLSYVDAPETKETDVRVFEYNTEKIDVKELKEWERIDWEPIPNKMKWIKITGHHPKELLNDMGEFYRIHPLILEDILNYDQRPKIESQKNFLFLVFKTLQMEKGQIRSTQISLFLMENVIISLQEEPSPVIKGIIDRLMEGKGRMRKKKTDYLAYCLMDVIIDNYFLILEGLGDEIDKLEKNLIDNPSTDVLQKIHALKREMLYFRKVIWPMREIINKMDRYEKKLIQEETKIYIRDLYDHIIQIIDTIESLREVLSGMLDTYLSSVSNKMNDIMMLLTVISTIFIPLSLLAGIYGMNFQIMPELSWRWGYLFFWIMVIIISISMIFYFKKRNWLVRLEAKQ